MQTRRATQARRIARGIAVTILTTVVATLPAYAESRPFRMSLQGNAGPAPTSDPCILTNSERGTGQALHLGSMTWASEETVNLCAPGGPSVSAQFVLVAANGDRVNGTLHTAALFDFATNQVTFAGVWEIAGGTGRFAAASGHGTLTGWGNLLPPFEVTAEFSGEVAY